MEHVNKAVLSEEDKKFVVEITTEVFERIANISDPILRGKVFDIIREKYVEHESAVRSNLTKEISHITQLKEFVDDNIRRVSQGLS